MRHSKNTETAAIEREREREINNIALGTRTCRAGASTVSRRERAAKDSPSERSVEEEMVLLLADARDAEDSASERGVTAVELTERGVEEPELLREEDESCLVVQ